MASAVQIIISAKDMASQTIRRFGLGLEAESRRWEAASKKLNSLTSAIDKVMLGVAAASTAAAGAGLKLAASLEQNKIAFTQMLGSAEKAGAMLEELGRFAEKTPFEFDDVTAASKKLMGLGWAAEDVIPTLTAVGDAAARVGGGREAMEGVILALSQISLKGKVSAEELNQLAERGIPAYEFLRDRLHLTAEQMQNIGKAGLEAKPAVEAIVAGMEEWAKGMMDVQSASASGLWSTAVDQIKAFGLAMVGMDRQGNIMSGSLFDVAKKKLEAFTVSMRKWQQDGTLEKWANKVREGFQKASVWVEKIYDWLDKMFKYISNNGDTIIAWGKNIVRFWVFTKVVTGLSNIVSAINSIRIACDLLGKSAIARVLLGVGAGTAAVAGAGALMYNDMARANAANPNTNVDVWGNPKKPGTHGSSSFQWNSITPLPYAPKTKGEVYGPPGPPPGWKTGSNAAVDKAIEKATADKVTVASILKDMDARLAAAGRMHDVLGKAYDLNSEKAAILDSALSSLATTSERSTIPAMKNIAKRLETVAPDNSVSKFLGPTIGVMDAGIRKAKDLADSVAEANAIQQQRVWLMEREVNASKRAKEAAEEAADAAFREQAAVEVAVNQGRIDKARRGSMGDWRPTGKTAPEPTLWERVGNAAKNLLAPFAELANIITQLNPITALVNATMQALAPVIENLLAPIVLVGAALATAIAPVLKALFPVFKVLGQVVIAVAKAIAAVWNGLVSIIDAIPFVDMSAWYINTQALSDAQASLAQMTWDNAAATLENYQATHQLVGETNKATEAMRNVPEIFKVALRRNQVAAPIPAMASGGIVTRPTVALIGEAGPEAVVPLGKGIGGPTIYVDARGSSSPREVERAAKRGVERAYMARYGLAGGVA